MLKFRIIISLLQLVTVFHAAGTIGSQFVSSSSLIYEYVPEADHRTESLISNDISSETGHDHLLTKRNAFETFRELADDALDPSKLIVNRRIYNSSVALTIPFFSFKVPNLPDAGFLVKQAIFGAFAWGIVILPFFLSFIFTGSVPSDEQSRSFQQLSNTAKKSSFNFLGPDFSKSFGMDGGQCIQKVICQAHRLKEGKKYGILATSLRTLFPVPENFTISSNASPFQSAAIAGKFKGKDCDNLYDCILDPLGSARYLIHWYGHHNENARHLLQMVDYDSTSPKGTAIDTL